MPTDPTDAPRGPGRPRTRPADVRECPVYLTPTEIDAADSLARAAGVSRAEWLRRLAVAEIARKTRAKK